MQHCPVYFTYLLYSCWESLIITQRGGGGFNQPLPLVPQWGYELACMSKGQSDSECHCLRRHKFLCQCGLLKWRLGQVDFETLPLVISEII